MMRKCPNCGNTIRNREICPICGKNIGLQVSAGKSRPQINKSLPKPPQKASSKPKKEIPLKNKSETVSKNELEEDSHQLGSIASSLLGILCIAGVMLIVLSGVLSPDTTNSTNVEKKNVIDNITDSDQLTIQVNVVYNKQWSGSIGLNDDLKNYNQNGSKTVVYSNCVKEDTISASIQKKDSTEDELKVQVLMNNVIIKEESTKTPYGIVTISI